MIRFYRHFEDIARQSFQTFSRLENIIIALPDDVREHLGYAYQHVGEVKPHVPDTYILIETLKDGTYTRRRGYFQFDGAKPWTMPIPEFKPTEPHQYRAMARDIEDALMITGLMRRMSNKVPENATHEVLELLDIVNAQGQKLAESLAALMCVANRLKEAK